jgi:hypothetical protein
MLIRKGCFSKNYYFITNLLYRINNSRLQVKTIHFIPLSLAYLKGNTVYEMSLEPIKR